MILTLIYTILRTILVPFMVIFSTLVKVIKLTIGIAGTIKNVRNQIKAAKVIMKNNANNGNRKKPYKRRKSNLFTKRSRRTEGGK